MNFTPAVHELIPEPELPQQQTAAALYCSSLEVPSHRRTNTNVLRTMWLHRTATQHKQCSNPYLNISLKCWSANRGASHELKLSVRVAVVIKHWFQWKCTITKLLLLKITFYFQGNETDHSNTKMKYFGKKKKKVLKSIHNQVPHHSYLPFKGRPKEKKKAMLWQGFFNILK